MKKALVAVVSLVLSLAANTVANDALGSLFGNLSTARAIGQGRTDLGGGVGVGDNFTTFYGTLTYGLSQYMDGRLELGIADPDHGDSKLSFGADLMYQIWSVEDVASTHPFDMALGGFVEHFPGEFVTLTSVGGRLIGSKGYLLSGGTELSPYGAVNIRLEAVSVDLGPFGDVSESNLKFGVNAGVAWKVSSTMRFFGELQLDGNDGFMFGISFNVM